MSDRVVSMGLSNILRHSAHKQGIAIDEDGYALFSDLLRSKRIKGRASTEQVLRIVRDCPKQRFAIRPIAGQTEAELKLALSGQTEAPADFYIRANQGHSMELKVVTERISNPLLYPLVMHGTYEDKLPLINRGGLRTMRRQHIHFSYAETLAQIKPTRSTCEVGIIIDLAAAIKDDIPFYISQNGIVLTPGLRDIVDGQGVLPPKYFLQTVRLGRTKEKPKKSPDEFPQKKLSA